VNGEPGARPTLRLDRWLWHARFFRTRSLAARAVADTGVRVNAVRTDKPGRAVAPGDVLTFTQAGRVRVVRVVAPGARRGPPAEAAALYEDLAPPATDEVPGPAPRGPLE
jgi:ribosome-associated heat shock protein Hsp15